MIVKNVIMLNGVNGVRAQKHVTVDKKNASEQIIAITLNASSFFVILNYVKSIVNGAPGAPGRIAQLHVEEV